MLTLIVLVIAFCSSCSNSRSIDGRPAAEENLTAIIPSPDQRYRLNVYHNDDGGATVADSVTVTVTGPFASDEAKGTSTREWGIYWEYRHWKIEAEWLSSTQVKIHNLGLNQVYVIDIFDQNTFIGVPGPSLLQMLFP